MIKKKWFVFVVVYVLSLLPILNCIFDYAEWDEAGYTLASQANFEQFSYQTYNTISPSIFKIADLKAPFVPALRKTLPNQNEFMTYVYPYPNLLYSFSLGAFRHFFSLPPDHHARLIFILVLLPILSFVILLLSFSILSVSSSLWTVGGIAFFVNVLFFITLFELKGAQLGATTLFILSFLCLWQSYKGGSQGKFLLLAVVFLFLSFLWKEQILPFLFLFFWFFPSVRKKTRFFRWGVYFVVFCFLLWGFYEVMSLFSLNAGLSTMHYYYSSENKAWAPEFQIEDWIDVLSKMPLTFFLLFLLAVFIIKKDYREFFLLENKLFFLGIMYFLMSTIFYFYQTVDYVTGINYPVLVFSSIYFLSRISDIKKLIAPSILLFLGIFMGSFIIWTFYQNSQMPRVIPLFSLWKDSPKTLIPCVDTQSSLYALNHPVLASIYIKKDIGDRPFLLYANMSQKEFLKSLQIYHPSIIFFRTDRTEYPFPDRYMTLYRMRKKIDVEDLHYGFGGDISAGIFFFVRKATVTKKNLT